MRAVDHYLEAERQIEHAEEASTDSLERRHLLCAQVHATLALAGASALQSYARVEDDDLELAEWAQAAGGWDSEADGSEKP